MYYFFDKSESQEKINNLYAKPLNKLNQKLKSLEEKQQQKKRKQSVKFQRTDYSNIMQIIREKKKVETLPKSFDEVRIVLPPPDKNRSRKKN